ncbi:hypothetical protein B7P43_G10981, partial [Cryptotermes secundus]
LNCVPCVCYVTASIPKCGGCQELILDRFILKVLDRTWHAKCLKCSECSGQLSDKCFARNGQVFCKDDFFKRYGTKCAGCEQGIPPTQVVRRAQDNVYHLQCFACVMCSRQLNTGDEFYLMEDRKLVCKPDYEAAKTKGMSKCPSPHSLSPLKRLSLCAQWSSFANNFNSLTSPNCHSLRPGMRARPRDGEEEGYMLVLVRLWSNIPALHEEVPTPSRHFMPPAIDQAGNDRRMLRLFSCFRRAKEKRLKKDAGRTRWSQYFRSMKGGSSPRHEKLHDKDDKMDLESNFSHTHAVLTLWSLLPKCYGVQPVCSFVSVDLNSNDSYGTVVNLGLEQDGSSPHSAGSRAPHFTLHGGPATPPYLSSSHSPTPPHPALGPNFPYSTGEGLAVYTTLGKSHIWLCDVIS